MKLQYSYSSTQLVIISSTIHHEIHPTHFTEFSSRLLFFGGGRGEVGIHGC